MGEKVKGDKDKRCFVIMPISDQGDYSEGHFTMVYEQIFKPAILKAGFEPYRVDENKICDSIINRIFEAVQNCPMALCDLSNRNPNVLYELGLRQAYDKPVVLVQDEKTERIFDVSGINTVGYKSMRLYEDVIEARKKITEAIKSTRDGKEISIVKVMKAEVANINSENLTKEDKMSIMLNNIMNDIQEIKRGQTSGYFKYPVSFAFGENEKIRCIGEFELRQGITDGAIKMQLLRLQALTYCEITYSRKADKIEITVFTDDVISAKNIIEALKRILGKKD